MPSNALTKEQNELKRSLRELHQKRMAEQRDYEDLQKFCKKLKKDKNATSKGLVDRYVKAMKDSADEMVLAQTCLQSLQRYVDGRVEKIYQENADIWAHAGKRILPSGSKVAACTSENLWVLAQVDSYHQGRQRYHVTDADAQQAKEFRKHYKLEASKLIPLPPLSEFPLNKRRLFKPGEWVFAVYPTTTAFYKARVLAGPKQNSKKGDAVPKYKLEFEDDGNEIREVHVTDVTPLPRSRPQ
mmetsp:Transcript_19113/g.34175  ORF Transcript_19113/g.34175 Transcript_19113/m.34175 type:complete len:242 (+) Transcript_19113:163-888(+)